MKKATCKTCGVELENDFDCEQCSALEAVQAIAYTLTAGAICDTYPAQMQRLRKALKRLRSAWGLGDESWNGTQAERAEGEGK